MIALALLLAASVFADPHRARDFEAERLWMRKSVQLSTLSLIPKYELAAAPVVVDSITYTWTMPRLGARADSLGVFPALHSWMVPKLAYVARWPSPYFPPDPWNPQAVWIGVERAPGDSLRVTIASPGYGTAWVVAIGPGGSSKPSNYAPSRTR